jgi:serine/threonine protein kinase
MTVASTVSLRPLTTALERSQLLGPSHLAEFHAWRSTHPESDGEAAALWLVDQGWVTRWQAQQLLSGQHSFFLRHYKLVSRLGGGGMGTVFQAIDDRTGRLVAVKVIRKSAMQRPNVIERFKREVTALGKLRHPNIVAAYEAGQLGAYHYLVMEYIEGRDVGHWVSKLKRLPIDMACEIARQAALGLEHAHRLGFIHRDIKPSNLIAVRKSDGGLDVRVLDFGLARTYEGGGDEARVTRTGQIVGTVDYLAPEQAQGSKTIDGRSDVYSLGVTLFEMIAGRPPFTGDSMMARLVARVMSPAPSLSEFVPGAPSAIVEAVAKALAFEPGARFATAGEFASALEKARVATTTEISAKEAAATTAAMTAVGAVEVGDAAKVRTPESLAPVYDEFQQALSEKARSSTHSTTLSALPVWVRRHRYWIVGFIGFSLLAAMGVAIGRAGARPASPTENTAAPSAVDPAVQRLMREVAALRERPNATRIQQVWNEIWCLTASARPQPIHSAARKLSMTAPHPLESTFHEGQEQRTVYKPGFFQFGLAKATKKLAFAPDGRTLASIGEGVVVLHDLIADASDELKTDVACLPSCLAFDQGGALLAVGCQDGSIHLWDMNRREHVRSLSGKDYASHVAFLDDGSKLVSTHRSNRAFLWTLSGGSEPTSQDFRLPHPPLTLSLLPGTESIVVGSHDGRTTVVDLKTGATETNHPFQTSIVAVEYSPDGKQVAVFGSEAVCWRIDGVEFAQQWSVPIDAKSKWVGAWSSPWVERLVSLSSTGRLQSRSWKTGAPEWERETLARFQQACAFAVSPDGRFAAVQVHSGGIELVRLPPLAAQ